MHDRGGAARSLCGCGPTVAEIAGAIRSRSFDLVLQPIVELSSSRWIALEVLSRFPGEHSPDAWFREAQRAGLAIELELVAAVKALDLLSALPDGISLSVNVSPETLRSGELSSRIRSYPHERIIFEITEQADFSQDDRLAKEVHVLQFRGARIAIDDVGAGWCRLQQILQLSPDWIKLDKSLVSGIGSDGRKQALLSGLNMLSRNMGAEIIVEGIETATEFNVLLSLGIQLGQGWLTGRPADLSVVLAQLPPLQQSDAA